VDQAIDLLGSIRAVVGHMLKELPILPPPRATRSCTDTPWRRRSLRALPWRYDLLKCAPKRLASLVSPYLASGLDETLRLLRIVLLWVLPLWSGLPPLRHTPIR
jgi:hypothetical protein